MQIFKKLICWFDAHSKMGTAIKALRKVEKEVSSESIEQSIALLHEARLEFDNLNNKRGYAAATLKLAEAITFRPNGEQEENLRRKIDLLEELLARSIQNENVNLQLSIYEKLDESYFQLYKSGGSVDFLDRSIEYSEKILEIVNPAHRRITWIEATWRLAGLFRERAQYKPDQISLKQSIHLLEKLLTNLIFWERWRLSGRIHYLLGNSYFELLTGNVGENKESAIYHLHKALDSKFFADEVMIKAEIYVTLAQSQPLRTRYNEASKRELIEKYFAEAQKLYDSAGEFQKAAELEATKSKVIKEWIFVVRPRFSPQDFEVILAAKNQLDEITPKTELEKWKEERERLEMECMFYSTQIFEKSEEIMRAASTDKYSQYFSEVIDLNLKNISQETRAAHLPLFKTLEKKCDELEQYSQSILKLLSKEEYPIEAAMAHLSLAGVNTYRSWFLSAETEIEHYQQQSFYWFNEALSVLLELDSGFLLGFITRNSGFPILFINKHWKEAADLLGAALKAQEQVYRTSLSEKGKENALREIGDPIFGLASAQAYTLARLGKTIEAVETLERWRGRKVGELLQRDSRNLKTMDAGIFKEYCEAVEKINILEAHQRNNYSWDLAAVFDELKSTRDQLAAIIKQIRLAHPDFMIEPVFKDIQQAASKDKPLAYILTTEVGSLVLLVFDKGEPLALWEDSFTKGNLFSLLAGSSLENSMEESIVENPARLDSVILPNCTKLPEKLFNELKARKAKGVVIIPCGTLALLPIHAIPIKEKGCLLDNFDIHYAPSAYTMLLANRSLSESWKSSPHFLGFGDPDQSLNNAEPEVRLINSLFKNSGKSDVFIHEEATLENLQNNIQNATHIHFSCHGKFGMTNTLDSSLLLAQNERLTLKRILDDRHFKSLKEARLVVLSACQTSLVEVSTNPDESVGITLGFLSAGVSGVIGTLWSVPDISTALLMVTFYRKHILEKIEPAQALRFAQRWLRDATSEQIKKTFTEFDELSDTLRLKTREADFGSQELAQESDRPFANPYYWAGFILVGT